MPNCIIEYIIILKKHVLTSRIIYLNNFRISKMFVSTISMIIVMITENYCYVMLICYFLVINGNLFLLLMNIVFMFP